MHSLKLITAPYAEPVDLEAAKRHCRIDIPDDDADVQSWIVAARSYCERFLRRQLVTATYRMTLDKFPCGGEDIDIPVPPLQSVSSITYLDLEGATQTVSTSIYAVDADREPGRITLAYNQSWPTVRTIDNAVAVNFRAGYITPFTVVPSTEVLTVKGRTFTNNDIVRVTNSGGALPPPLATYTDYHVVEVSGSTLKLSLTSGGSAINITDAGVGTHFIGEVPGPTLQAIKLLIGHYNENREAILTGTVSKEIEFAVESLLWSERWGSYA